MGRCLVAWDRGALVSSWCLHPGAKETLRAQLQPCAVKRGLRQRGHLDILVPSASKRYVYVTLWSINVQQSYAQKTVSIPLTKNVLLLRNANHCLSLQRVSAVTSKTT